MYFRDTVERPYLTVHREIPAEACGCRVRYVPYVRVRPAPRCSAALRPSCGGQQRDSSASGGRTPSSEEEPRSTGHRSKVAGHREAGHRTHGTGHREAGTPEL